MKVSILRSVSRHTCGARVQSLPSCLGPVIYSGFGRLIPPPSLPYGTVGRTCTIFERSKKHRASSSSFPGFVTLSEPTLLRHPTSLDHSSEGLFALPRATSTTASLSAPAPFRPPVPTHLIQASIPNNIFWSLVAASAFFIAATLHSGALYPSDDTPRSDQEPILFPSPEDAFTMPAIELQPGRPGNLTAEQEEKLCEFWDALLKLCGVSEGEDASGSEPPILAVPKTELGGEDGQKQKKKRMGLFSRKPSDKKGDPESTTNSSNPALTSEDTDDKYGQTKEYYDTLATMTPQQLHEAVWSMVKHDHPDALCLRFLRARKWDVQKALIMMVSTMNWRAIQMKVDSKIMKEGEAGAITDSQANEPKAKKAAEGFLQLMRQGKTLLHGVDKKGSPVCIVRVRLHKVGEQSEEALERYTVYLIETARMMLRPPVDTATMVFDMTGFSLQNMDYAPVKFIVKCFEANYPESLQAVLVHKAPWIFQGIWKIIRGWLDPVVASKIAFTNSVQDLEQYLPADKILKELEGSEKWEYQYIEPTPGENDKMNDIATRDSLQASRSFLVQDYAKATLEWIKVVSDREKAAPLKERREELAAKLRTSYWELDPYVRARSLFDRVGIIQGEKVDFYPQENAPANGAAKVETSVNDLD